MGHRDLFRAALRIVMSCGAALAVAIAPAAEPPLYLVDSTFDGALTRVYAVDPDSGAMTERADLDTRWTPALGMAAADGSTLYLAGSDTSGLDRCAGRRACILLRVVLDPVAPVPLSAEEIGAIRAGTETVSEIVGLTFDAAGRLYASSQTTDALYLVDPMTADAVEVGRFGVDIDGGDITTDADGRLLLWNSLGALAGLYDVDPLTGTASVFELHPNLNLSGMAAVGHTKRLLGTSPPGDLLYEIDSVAGLKSSGPVLSLDGARFDHKRGDLDSPFCVDDPACDDGDLCTINRCAPGGCAAEAVDPDDADACTIDTCDPAVGPVHVDLRLADTDADGIDDCVDVCPGTAARQRVEPGGCSVDQLCPCDAGWPNHGAYVSCVSAAVERTGEGGPRISLAARSGCARKTAQPARWPREDRSRRNEIVTPGL